MKLDRHLTLKEIYDYHHSRVSEPELRLIGRHILNCEDCRRVLPLPTVEMFWKAILEDEIPESDEERFLTKIKNKIVNFL